MTEAYDWNPMPHKLDIRCPSCSSRAVFEFAEVVKINLKKEFIRHDNILDLFAKYNVPIDLDLFSEDTDYGDFWIVEKVLEKYKPKIVVHEINQQKPPACVTVQKPDRLIYFDSK